MPCSKATRVEVVLRAPAHLGDVEAARGRGFRPSLRGMPSTNSSSFRYRRRRGAGRRRQSGLDPRHAVEDFEELGRRHPAGAAAVVREEAAEEHLGAGSAALIAWLEIVTSFA